MKEKDVSKALEADTNLHIEILFTVVSVLEVYLLGQKALGTLPGS